MFENSYNVEGIQIEYITTNNGCSQILLKFQKNQDNLEEQTNKLLKFMKLNQDNKYANIFQQYFGDQSDKEVDQNTGETKEEINIDKSKIGYIILSQNLNIKQQYSIDQDLIQLSQNIKFYPNLVSLHINFINKNGVCYEKNNFYGLWENLTHFNRLIEIKVDIINLKIYSLPVVKMINSISNIPNLQALFVFYRFIYFSVEDWKQMYLYLMKLKKLNTLSLVSPFDYYIQNYSEQLIAYNYHKKLLRLVTKNIDF